MCGLIRLCAALGVKCNVNNVQSLVVSLQHAVFCVLCAVSAVFCVLCFVQCSVFGVLCFVFCAVPSVLCSVFCVLCSVQCSVAPARGESGSLGEQQGAAVGVHTVTSLVQGLERHFGGKLDCQEQLHQQQCDCKFSSSPVEVEEVDGASKCFLDQLAVT